MVKKRKLPRIAGLSSISAAAASADSGPRAPQTLPEGKAGTTIAIYSVKGGVGKTTFSANLAWCSQVNGGHDTLLWDLDAAGGSGFLFDLEPRKTRQAEGVFSREKAAAKLIRHTRYPGIDVLPADESIRALDAQLVLIGKRKRLARLTQELTQDYARIVLDCPPVMNELSAQIIRAADLVIVPLPPSPLSARALDLVVREIAQAGKKHPPILPVLSMLDMRRTLHRDVQAAHPDWPSVPYASVIEQCAVRREPVGAFAPGSPAAMAFHRLWAAIDDKIKKTTKA